MKDQIGELNQQERRELLDEIDILQDKLKRRNVLVADLRFKNKKLRKEGFYESNIMRKTYLSYYVDKISEKNR